MLLAWPTGNGDQIATSFRYSSYVCFSPGEAYADAIPVDTKLLLLTREPHLSAQYIPR
jgi:hypothetical protein